MTNPEELDLFADENEPEAIFHGEVYCVRLPRDRWMEYRTGSLPFLYVEVEEDGLINILDYSHWNGKRVKELTHNEQREIFEYLREWELIALQKIGPEDREWFATKKLSSKLGVE